MAKIMEIIEKETRGKATTHISIAMTLSVCRKSLTACSVKFMKIMSTES